MNQEYFERWAEMAKKAQEPFRAFTELNVKTLQGLNYIRPDEFTNIRKPEELLEKQVNAFIDNGHKGLNYMQESWKIFEKMMFAFLQETKQMKPTKGQSK